MSLKPLSLSSTYYITNNVLLSVFQVFGRYDYSDDIHHSYEGSRIDAIVDNLRVGSRSDKNGPFSHLNSDRRSFSRGPQTS